MSVITGPWRQPRNGSADEAGGIHHDQTAQGLGFRGGTVAGSIHLEQCPPLLVSQFGEAWHRTGNLSLYFTHATVDREPVRVVLTGGSGQAAIRLETEAGTTVAEGTCRLGPDPDSALRRRVAAQRPPGSLRMLAGCQAGQRVMAVPARISSGDIDRRLTDLTETDPAFTDPSRYGGRMLPLSSVIHLMRVIEEPLAPLRPPFVGLFGAAEIQFLNGPVLADRDYLVDGEILALGESPKTELIWFHACARDKTGVPVAEMILLSRLLKASSPLWGEGL